MAPRGKRPIKQRVKKRVFLKRVKKRLEQEVGIYFNLLFEAQDKNVDFPKVGFWAGIRLIMPVIDALSEVLLRKSKNDLRPKPVRFMEKYLSIDYPYLVWEMYRHSLIHCDELRSIVYRKHKVSWGVSIGLDSHSFLSSQTMIDLTKLYGDLISFLEREIPEAKGSVYVERYIKFGNKIPKPLKEEILELGK